MMCAIARTTTWHIAPYAWFLGSFVGLWRIPHSRSVQHTRQAYRFNTAHLPCDASHTTLLEPQGERDNCVRRPSNIHARSATELRLVDHSSPLSGANGVRFGLTEWNWFEQVT